MSKILKSFGMAALLVALLAGTGMAADMTITGDVQAAVEVTVSPSAIDLWTLNVGVNTYTDSATNATITSNHGSGKEANLMVAETGVGADGKMANTANGALANALVLKATSTPTILVDTTLSESTQDIYTLDTAGTATVDFDYQQVITFNDVEASDYGIIVTFTGAIEEVAG